MQEKRNIKQSLESISSIPTLPVVIDKLARLLQNPKTSAEEVGKAITTDQALASKVLKLVNSAFYGFPGKISTITHAIVILGFSTIKNVVLTASIFDAFRKQGTIIDGFDLEQFWLHSIACGAAAQSIAKTTGHNQKEECFIAGLIHDIGKIILCQNLPEDFRDAHRHAREHSVLFFESEKTLFDVTHQEIGGFLTQKWNLPKDLQNAVKFHHDPSPTRDHYTMTAIVHCADIFIRALDYGNGGDRKIPVMSEHVWKNLGLDSIPLNHLFEVINDEIEKASVFVQLT
ncbi:MAG TPA: HDOD domain-containing protein [Chitinispirillaceae bacterium]|nr:HDOD domain-containing protein [Chitinispirillaceae bacterium]